MIFSFSAVKLTWFIFHFNNAQNQAARKWRVKKWPPFSESGFRDVVYSLIPCWLFVINTTPLHSWSCLGVFTNYVDNNFVGMHGRWSIMGHILSTQFVNAPFESKVETVIIIAIVQKRMSLVYVCNTNRK